MNDLQGQRDEMFMDKNVSACDLSEIVVCSYKELTYNVVKDMCVDEGVPMMQEKFLLNDKGSAKVNANPVEYKSSEYNTFEEFSASKDTMELVVTGEKVEDDYEVYHEVGCEKSPIGDVVAKPGSVSKEALTLGDIIAMEDSHKPCNKNNINEPDQENVGREMKQKRTRRPKSDSWRYLSFELDSYDHHHLLSSNFQNAFGERSFSESESGVAHITYSGPISVCGSLSVRSDGSTVSANSFAFPILQSEWNSSPVRMVKVENRQLRKEKGWRHYSILLCCRF